MGMLITSWRQGSMQERKWLKSFQHHFVHIQQNSSQSPWLLSLKPHFRRAWLSGGKAPWISSCLFFSVLFPGQGQMKKLPKILCFVMLLEKCKPVPLQQVAGSCARHSAASDGSSNTGQVLLSCSQVALTVLRNAAGHRWISNGV